VGVVISVDQIELPVDLALQPFDLGRDHVELTALSRLLVMVDLHSQSLCCAAEGHSLVPAFAAFDYIRSEYRGHRFGLLKIVVRSLLLMSGSSEAGRMLGRDLVVV